MKQLLQDLRPLTGYLLIAAILGFMIGKGQMGTVATLIALPFVVAFLIWIFYQPVVAFLASFHLSFVSNGMTRFIEANIPWGLGVDFLLLICIVATIFKRSQPGASGRSFSSPLFWLMFGWFLFTLVELVNPEARSKEAWFYAARGLSFYPMQIIALIYLLMDTEKEMDRFINYWMIWSLVSAFYGFKMHYLGVTAGERKWLDNGGSITHEIQGQLRIFSFYSDAGQFGAAMAHTTLFALLMAIGPYEKKVKRWYWFLVAVCFWAYALSGSRGPLFVIAGGGALYLFLIGNVRILIIGGMIGALLFGILKYTHIGDGNYQIHRMRTGLDPNDASLQVRLDNQKKLKAYLATRPLGGGIGSGGSWGQRFTPGSFLAETALDSWYVKVWVETGIIGLWLHIISLMIILGYGVINCFRIREPGLRQKIIALTAGFFGIAVASYGNQVLGQQPTGYIIYFSWAYMFLAVEWEKEKQQNQKVHVKIT
ncbi:MAG: O-antigen ligase domain-containing protein [Bacteroidia bacterium]|nr:O-antigen ligase domain-containing protein [Bacteroidia bacterium]